MYVSYIFAFISGWKPRTYLISIRRCLVKYILTYVTRLLKYLFAEDSFCFPSTLMHHTYFAFNVITTFEKFLLKTFWYVVNTIICSHTLRSWRHACLYICIHYIFSMTSYKREMEDDQSGLCLVLLHVKMNETYAACQQNISLHIQRDICILLNMFLYSLK